MLDILYRMNGGLGNRSKKQYFCQRLSSYRCIIAIFCDERAGYAPDKFFLMHINNQYIKNGELTDEFFHLEDITDKVLSKQTWVEENLERLLVMLENKQEPNISIGAHCSSPLLVISYIIVGNIFRKFCV